MSLERIGPSLSINGELANVNEAMHILYKCASGNRSLMVSPVEDQNRVHDQLATMLVKGQIAKKAPDVAFHHFLELSCRLRMG